MKILIVRNSFNSKALDSALLLSTFCMSQGIECSMVDSSELITPVESQRMHEILGSGCDLVVVLGGDGTILHTAHYVGYSGVPILGLNYGSLGFLADSCEDGVVAAVATALAGDAVEDRRTNLKIRVVLSGEKDPYDDCVLHCSDWDRSVTVENATDQREFFALNEASITRGALGKIIDFSLSVSGSHVADMRGDGLVVSTATGSTAYALSAGGPLVSPGFGGLIAVPIAPHTLHSRAIVTAENDVMEVDLTGNAAHREATLFVDGDMIAFDKPIARMYVQRGETPTTLLRLGEGDFYKKISKTFF